MANIDLELRQVAKTAALGGGGRLNMKFGAPRSTREYVL